jgi:hypothetical protein
MTLSRLAIGALRHVQRLAPNAVSPADHFNELTYLLEARVPFSFVRFSDGELFVLLNKFISLKAEGYTIGSRNFSANSYPAHEQKLFDPELHSKQRIALINSLRFQRSRYFVGLPCPCCSPLRDYLRLWINSALCDLDNGWNPSRYTWANLLINSNYSRYIALWPNIFNQYNVVLISNRIASVDNLPFRVMKRIDIGNNCFVNDFDRVSAIASEIDAIAKRSDKSTLALFSAASLSNLLIHRVSEINDNVTCIDIGSSLNPLLQMSGWESTRTYLTNHWLDVSTSDHLMNDLQPFICSRHLST